MWIFMEYKELLVYSNRIVMFRSSNAFKRYQTRLVYEQVEIQPELTLKKVAK